MKQQKVIVWMDSWIRVDPFNGDLSVVVTGKYGERTRILLAGTEDEVFN